MHRYFVVEDTIYCKPAYSSRSYHDWAFIHSSLLLAAFYAESTLVIWLYSNPVSSDYTAPVDIIIFCQPISATRS